MLLGASFVDFQPFGGCGQYKPQNPKPQYTYYTKDPEGACVGNGSGPTVGFGDSGLDVAVCLVGTTIPSGS